MKAQNKEEKLAKQQVCVFDNIAYSNSQFHEKKITHFLCLHFSGEGKITT